MDSDDLAPNQLLAIDWRKVGKLNLPLQIALCGMEDDDPALVLLKQRLPEWFTTPIKGAPISLSVVRQWSWLKEWLCNGSNLAASELDVEQQHWGLGELFLDQEKELSADEDPRLFAACCEKLHRRNYDWGLAVTVEGKTWLIAEIEGLHRGTKIDKAEIHTIYVFPAELVDLNS
jgi:hypothetical protein